MASCAKPHEQDGEVRCSLSSASLARLRSPSGLQECKWCMELCHLLLRYEKLSGFDAVCSPKNKGGSVSNPFRLTPFLFHIFFFNAFLPFLPPLSFLHTCTRPVCSPSQVPASPASVCPCFSLKPAVCISLFSSSPQKKNEVFVCCLLGFVCLPWNTSCTEASLAISCPYSLCNPDAPDRCCIHHISQRGKLLVFTPCFMLLLWHASLVSFSTAVLELLNFVGVAEENVVEGCALPFEFCAGCERTIPEHAA